jgi:ADP-L-glycero-D-manno-heptose 6-epimerase
MAINIKKVYYENKKPLNEKSSILVTGGAGLIGSAIIKRLNDLGVNNIDVCDNLGTSDKWKNLSPLNFKNYIELNEFKDLLNDDKRLFQYDYVFHLGACSDTTENDMSYLIENNYRFTCKLANKVNAQGSKFIYASSAATYGDCFIPFSDDETFLKDLRPLNKYAFSKHLIDKSILAANGFQNLGIVSLKYSNVFGPNEYHKGNMRSMFIKCYEQIKSRGYVELFKSYNENYKDGEQVRDFIYVKDAADMTIFFATEQGMNLCGIYNIGSGITTSWNKLAKSMFKAMNMPVDIRYIDMPENLKNKYQYYTCLDIQKIKEAGYNKKLYTIEESSIDYVKYLENNKHLGEEND